MTDYLALAEVLDIHGDQIERYADLIEQAAALWESLAQNHPFIDGNKRTGFAATYTFVAVNGARIAADAKTAYVFIAGLYETNDFTFEKLAAWRALRFRYSHSRPSYFVKRGAFGPNCL
jgi:death-on-curing protein